MNFTNSELVGLISMTKDRLSDSKNVIKRQEKIIIDHHKYKDDQQIIELSLHTLKQLKEDHKKLASIVFEVDKMTPSILMAKNCIRRIEHIYLKKQLEHYRNKLKNAEDSFKEDSNLILKISEIQNKMKAQAIDIAKELKIIGLMNIQFAIKANEVYIIEVNPRASRTVPFISKAIGHSLAKVASKAMIGKSLIKQKFSSKLPKGLSFVKEAVMPFDKFPHVDPILGPEMKSTGEVMGIGPNFGEAYAKAQKGANKILRKSGNVFISVKSSDKKYLDEFTPAIINAGFEIIATSGTADYIEKLGYAVSRINKVTEGRPHIVDMLLNNEIDLVINTTEGSQSIQDSASIRQSALRNKIFCTTTMFGAFAIIDALKSIEENWTYSTLQEINK